MAARVKKSSRNSSSGWIEVSEMEVAVQNNLEISDVENTFIRDCALNAFSSDQIGQLHESASAKYGKSFLCGAHSSAAFIKELYSDTGTTTIFISKNDRNNIKSDASISEAFIMRDLSRNSSSNTYSGEISLCVRERELISDLRSERGLKNEKRMFASII